jgi:transglutaminase-like putative cysteine protease
MPHPKKGQPERMRYRVRHVSRYAYDSPVELATHMVHLRPRMLPCQTVISETIETSPDAARRRDGHDHFGNRVTWLFLDRSHEDFDVTAESIVEVGFPPPPDAAATPPWEDVVEASSAGQDWHASEFCFSSAMAPRDEASFTYAAASFPPGRSILDGLLDLNRRIHREFRFRAGVTSVSTPVSRVMERRQGVCQDFSHVMISGLRGLGLPARYVSGYIRTRPPPGQPRRQGADQSHAWVGCWLGPTLGWVDLDPTNDLLVQNEHVVLGWGRDYGDVSPVRGVILGGGDHTLDVTVDLAPDDEEV